MPNDKETKDKSSSVKELSNSSPKVPSSSLGTIPYYPPPSNSTPNAAINGVSSASMTTPNVPAANQVSATPQQHQQSLPSVQQQQPQVQPHPQRLSQQMHHGYISPTGQIPASQQQQPHTSQPFGNVNQGGYIPYYPPPTNEAKPSQQSQPQQQAQSQPQQQQQQQQQPQQQRQGYYVPPPPASMNTPQPPPQSYPQPFRPPQHW